MTKQHSLMLCVIFLGFSLLQSFHFAYAAQSASATFQIRAVLVDPVSMETNTVDSKLIPKIQVQRTVAASLSTFNAATTNVHASITKNDTTVSCHKGACKGNTVELANVVLKTLDHSTQKKLELDATDKVAAIDKPGLYLGDMTVLLAVL